MAEATDNNTGNDVRICVLVDSFYPIIGGGELHTRNLCEGLVNRGLALFVLTRRRDKAHKAYEIADNTPVYRVPPAGMPRWGKYLMFFPAFIKLVQLRSQYDVIYISVFRSIGILGVFASKLLGKQCVLRAGVSDEMSGRNILDEYRQKTLLLPFVKAFLSIRNAILRQANGFISISKAIQADFLYAGVPAAKIHHIPNGVDTDLFKPVSAETRKTLRQSLRLPDKKIFCFTGKLNRGKGLDLLLETWVSIADRYPQAYLLLIGGGEHQFLSYENELREFVHRHGLEESTGFTGYTTSVPQYLQAADYFVFPSEAEGMPNSLLEALACGLPALASRIDGVTDIVTHDRDALLFEARNREQLGDGMERLINEPGAATRLGAAGRKTVVEQFSYQTMVDRYYHVLTTIQQESTR